MTSISSNNPTLNINPNISLQSPGSEGDQYGSLVTNSHGAVVGGEGENPLNMAAKGYSTTDTIGSADGGISSLYGQINIALLIPANAFMDYISQLDPTQPALPPIKGMLVAAARALQSGNIGGISLSPNQKNALLGNLGNSPSAQSNNQPNVNSGQPQSSSNSAQTDFSFSISKNAQNPSSDSEDAQNPNSNSENPQSTLNSGQTDSPFSISKDAQSSNNNSVNNNNQTSSSSNAQATSKTAEASNAAPTTSVAQPGTNPWLAGSPYVNFLIVFMEMQRMLMQNQVVEGKVELNAMKETVDLAKTEASLIMATAKENQALHIVAAVSAAVSMAVTLGAFAFAVRGAYKGTPGTTERAGMISSAGQSFDKFVTSTSQAATDILIATQEGRQKVLDAYKQIAQAIMQKSGDAAKADVDAITQLLQALESIRKDLKNAIDSTLQVR